MNENIWHNNGEPMGPAQEDVFRHYSDALHRFFYFRTADNEIADDLVQETIMRTFRVRGIVRVRQGRGSAIIFVCDGAERVRQLCARTTETSNG